MRTFFKALIFIAGGALFSVAASAAPTLLYQFQLNQIGCVSACPGTIAYDELNDMTLGLTSTAVAEGGAGLTIRSDFFDGLAEFSNSGFSSLSLALFPGAVSTVSLDPNSYSSGGPGLTLQFNLTVNSPLAGSLYVNDTSSEIVMGTSKDFAVAWLGNQLGSGDLFDPASGEWTGFIRSDALASFILPFRGEWRFIAEVPEPGTSSLVLVALAATLWSVRRRRLPARWAVQVRS